MNIIIAGLGKIGIKLAERLSKEENINVTVVDKRREIIQSVVNTYDVLGVVGNATSIDTLEDAGVKDADVLIAATNSDEINLLTCLIARKTGGCKTIARVRDPQYSKEIHLFKEDLGLAMIINPELISATEMSRILRFPSAIEIDTFAKGRVEILKFKIKEGSLLSGLKLVDLKSKIGGEVLVCGVERADEVFIPSGNFELKEGDLVSIVASVEEATAFLKKIGIKTDKAKDTLIIGGGTTAVYLANRLIKAGVDVKIIEQNPARCEDLVTLVPKATIINGDGTENNLLIEEGLENASSVVALTNIDEENVLLSLFAKTKTEGKIITKINRIAYDEVISTLGLDTIIYPRELTADYVIRFVRALNNSIGSNIETMHYILDDKAEALEFNVAENSPIANKKIEDLSLKQGILIACINRNGNIITPNGKSVICSGDTVIIVTTNKGFEDISDILR